MATREERLIRVAMHKKQDKIVVSDGEPRLNELTEGIPVIRRTTEGIVEYIRYKQLLYKKVYEKVA